MCIRDRLFINQFNGRKIIGTVGQLQFEVIQYRLENEYNAKCRWEPVSLYKACWVESDDPEELEAFKKRKYQYMAKDLSLIHIYTFLRFVGDNFFGRQSLVTDR